MKRNIPAFVALAAILAAGFSVSGCIGLVAGGAAATGVAAASEGGIPRAATDAAIRLQIHDLWFKHSVDMYRKLDMTVTEGRVLVTGTVTDPDMRVDAIRLVWQANGVKQVINEIRVDNPEGISGYARDTWITGRLRTAITFDRNVQAINYSIDTVGGTVYLMGIAQDEAELQRVIDHARNMSYVKDVVSYVRLRGETPPGVQEPTKGS